MNKIFKSQKIVLAILMVVAIFMLSSCATIFTGTKQDIYVNTDPPGAKVYVNGVDQGVLTPATIMVQRKSQVKYDFQKEGYIDGTVVQHGSFNFAVLANVFIGGLIGVVIDVSSGAMWQYNNQGIFYQFKASPDREEDSNIRSSGATNNDNE